MEDQSTNSWIDVLGSMAFTPVKNDMVGNIKVSTSRPPPESPSATRRLTETRKSATVN